MLAVLSFCFNKWNLIRNFLKIWHIIVHVRRFRKSARLLDSLSAVFLVPLLEFLLETLFNLLMNSNVDRTTRTILKTRTRRWFTWTSTFLLRSRRARNILCIFSLTQLLSWSILEMILSNLDHSFVLPTALLWNILSRITRARPFPLLFQRKILNEVFDQSIVTSPRPGTSSIERDGLQDDDTILATEQSQTKTKLPEK